MAANRREAEITLRYVHIKENLLQRWYDRSYDNTALNALEIAAESLVPILPDVQRYVYIAKQKCENPPNGLFRDDCAAIMLYTMEWEPSNQCLYNVLNENLRIDFNKIRYSYSRHEKPWSFYFKLFFIGLAKLPKLRTTIYCGTKLDLSKHYTAGKTIGWWNFSYCTTSIRFLQSECFFETTGDKTMFTIECESARDISKHSYSTDEDAVLLMPGTQLEVISCFSQGNLHIVNLKEICSPVDFFYQNPSRGPFSPLKSSSIPFLRQPSLPANINVSPINPISTSSSIGVSVTSPFYNACRNNNIDLVKHYLQTMPIEEINKIEPNGSTALHVAAYRGYEKIVELLLIKGASNSTINKYNCTPLDEAKTDNIKQMIRRRMNKTRFVSDSIEWIISTNDADYQAHQYMKILEEYGRNPNFHQLIDYIKQNYIETDLKDTDDINTIKEYFDMAIKKSDPIYLLKAYTAETGFYSTLNIHLAQLQLENLINIENLSRAYYIGIIAQHPKFESLSFTGKVFRGMIITNNDLKKYKIGTRILTKTFSSSSKQLNIALTFLENSQETDDRLSTLCIYEIRNQRTALDIEHISLFQYEQEVLILPCSAFKIIDIKINKDNLPAVEIKLKECEPW